MTDPRGGRPYQRWAKHILATLPPICTYHDCTCPTGRTIDRTLPGTHKWGPTLDHTTPLDHGGALMDPTNVQPMHRTCNTRKGNRAPQQTNSRQW